ncbi:methyl-accepting chemotaxis protein [Pseudoalteromonas ardens]|uniref:methyl-accepting chemotaxis protein n=1 Tax=Pseudoalteromonas ardens TaxID=3048490 RepID=UPI0009E30AB0|nr:methyl-accepting chemotaxis protein [Pseudoalteromonas sp. R96]MDK1311877.1 methyl-accepting chemotaxis protein [Pseudoalteromonas sp. R96]
MVQWLMGLSVKSRLVVGFGIALALLVVMTIIGSNRVAFIDQTLTEITDVNSVKQRYAINFRGSVHDRAIAIRDVAIARSASEIAEYEREIDQLARFYQDSDAKMTQMINSGGHFSAQEREILARIKRIEARTLPLIRTILSNKKAGQSVDALVLDEARPAFISWLNVINEFIDYQEQQNQTLTPAAREAAGGFSQLMLWFTFIAVAISVLVGWAIERSFQRSLGGEPQDAAAAVTRIAGGDLTMQIDTDYPDSMLDSVCRMSGELTRIVTSIKEVSEQLSVQASTVTGASGEIYDAAQHQAEATSNTAQMLDSLRENMMRVSDIAKQTEENSTQTVTFADQGRQAIRNTADAMDTIAQTVDGTVSQIQKLAEQTKQIGGIANVISGISEQTNLLALNAAIEAARAGESGRGFAVVADEVRQLARRTFEATDQIETMIREVQSETAATVAAMEKTQPQVEHGRTLTFEATELLEQIDNQAQNSLSQVGEVASVAQQQASAINDVASNMEEITLAAQDAMSALNDNKQATGKLSKMSGVLSKNIGFFRI